ncbi:substrate-binding domain-containing protein [Plebeiibacterium sediminum]|uniref:Substrate-binding domain-containing protein n=1 Tax=Plebeiibacterium sediminum TaxID=2992112 RepID=A0AAE3M817_9BACT|nr:substrate-binding domain-containing protein [Plebeiobacterium sediminum]MCW3788544.1 substrate-binding domain-containing protein [Plebeiobacterium sediminum]
MKKTVLIISVFLVGILILSSCKHKPHIGLLVDNLQQERWKKDMSIFEEKVKELGGTCSVLIADSDPDKQLLQAEEMIANGVEVLVVIPANQLKAGDIVIYAHQNHVPVISYDRLIKNCNLDYYISTDNIAIGELQAGYLTKIKPAGKYGIIGGSRVDNNAYLLNIGQLNILQPLIEKGDIEVVFNEYTNSWSLHEGYEITNNYLNSEMNQGLDAIIAGNDALAAGAISALKEHNLAGSVLVAGQDADIQAIRNIVGGNQTMTVYKPIEALAYTAADAAIKISKGIAPSNMDITINNGKRLVPAILLKSQVVHRQNIDLTVVSEGFISEQDIEKNGNKE